MAVSASKEPNLENYQLGGTLTTVLGQWTAHLCNHGTDTTGLGRWSHITLEGKNNCRYIILSGYWVVPKPPKLGTNTIYDQQYQLLPLPQGQTDPKP